ncbi:hypothetical protein, partial [Rhizobium sp.]|uniref:hypothetical protein n=1 Tax=Rhizobium sp. TaxID=391 RepID=UPI00389A4896
LVHFASRLLDAPPGMASPLGGSSNIRKIESFLNQDPVLHLDKNRNDEFLLRLSRRRSLTASEKLQ